MSDSMKDVVEALDPVSRRIIPSHIDQGTLVPLKTTLELRDNLTLGQAYITRAPAKSTNDVVNVARNFAGDDVTKNLPHLRRCAKPGDLPTHIKTQLVNQTATRALHVGKQSLLYIMIGRVDDIEYEELVQGLATVDGIRDDVFIGIIPVPLLAPTSQVQANMWSQQFWPTVYRKNNPLGPHPSNICRTTTALSRDASVWMSLAHKIAKQSAAAGYGEPIGAVIIKRTVPGKPDNRGEAGGKDDSSANGDVFKVADVAGNGGNGDSPDDLSGKGAPEKETTQIVAIAADARWYQQEKVGRTGNPMAHAALRAISMVAQKLVRTEQRTRPRPNGTGNGNGNGITPIMEFESFQDKPLFADEQTVFEEEHPCPDGYLCHELELYMTHEPCTMCAMAILHSRMGRIVFRQRMPLTGGMGSEDRGYAHCGINAACGNTCGGGQGLGLHWRKELNWSMLGWEWEATGVESLAVDPHLHA